MEKNLIEELMSSKKQQNVLEPNDSDNSKTTQSQETGQVLGTPVDELILGKFKSVDDLAKAYIELQKQQGLNSAELGEHRKNQKLYMDLAKSFDLFRQIQEDAENIFARDRQKYDTPEYFQDPTFLEMYKEAYKAIGNKLDTDKFVNLLEGYVASRIFANEQKNLENTETQNAINSMTYEKNPNNEIRAPKKTFDEMSQKEIDELLDRII